MSDREEEQSALQPMELERATLDDSASEYVAERLSKVDIMQPGERLGEALLRFNEAVMVCGPNLPSCGQATEGVPLTH
jgi:hypothetical protein